MLLHGVERRGRQADSGCARHAGDASQARGPSQPMGRGRAVVGRASRPYRQGDGTGEVNERTREIPWSFFIGCDRCTDLRTSFTTRDRRLHGSAPVTRDDASPFTFPLPSHGLAGAGLHSQETFTGLLHKSASQVRFKGRLHRSASQAATGGSRMSGSRPWLRLCETGRSRLSIHV